MDDLFQLENEMEKECEKCSHNYISNQATKELVNIFKSGFRIGWSKCREFYNIE